MRNGNMCELLCRLGENGASSMGLSSSPRKMLRIGGLVDNSMLVNLMDYVYNQANLAVNYILHEECEGFKRSYQRMIFCY